MTDVVDQKTYPRIMSSILGKDTKPELPGKPDIVFPRHNEALFVNGCFWHRLPDCRYASTPSSNGKFWNDKFEQNVARDQRSKALLEEAGLRVAVIWECETGSDCLDHADP